MKSHEPFSSAGSVPSGHFLTSNKDVLGLYVCERTYREHGPGVLLVKISVEMNEGAEGHDIGFGNQEQTELHLGELMKETDQLATHRVFECQFCGSRMAEREEGAPCPECSIRPSP